jgi:transmembrane sensor
VMKVGYTTAVGQRREIELPDKSVITLNTNTSVLVTYSARERNVWLARGEATFQVVHEEERPFFVRVDQRYGFQAVGTQFDIRVLTPDSVELIVTEGTVKLVDKPLEHPEIPALARLQANMTNEDTFIDALQSVQVEPGLQFPRKLESGEASDLLAWRHGRIIFKGQPLEDVLAEMSRYTNIQFVLCDQDLRGIRVSGDFRTGDIGGFLRSLRTNYRVDSQPVAGGRIALHSL